MSKVYLLIQERAARAPLQNQEPTSGSQGWRLPLIPEPDVPPVSQNPSSGSQGWRLPLIPEPDVLPVSQNPSAFIQEPEEPTRHQTRVTEGLGRRPSYTDPRGNILHPAIPLPTLPERTQKVAGMNIRERTQGDPIAEPDSGRERHAAPPHARNFRIDESATGLSTISAKPLPAASPRNICGLATNVKDSKGRSDTIDAVTIGGCLCIDSRYYGFTVAHVLSPNTRSPSDRNPKRDSPRSKFWGADTDLSDLSESDNELDASSVEAKTPATDIRLKEFLWKPASDSTSWQAVSTTSLIQDIALDWLLIPVESKLGQFENAIKIGQSTPFPQTIYAREVSEDLPEEVSHITLAAGKSGYRRVRLSRTLSGIFISSAGRVVKVWPVQHELDAVRPGDSGSWAIGDEGKVYSYLVGTCTPLGLSYIAPMAAAIGAMRAHAQITDVTFSSPGIDPVDLSALRGLQSDNISDSDLSDIRGDGEELEKLDHRYRKRLDAKKFFVARRVFAMLWHEFSGDKKSVYSRIRRMVVVRERHGYCWCIPICTYNYQGVAKKGLSTQHREAHCVIYMNNTDPAIDPKEKGLMTKKPIAVTASSPDQKLHKMSRLNFGKVYSMDWNVEVMNMGKVNADSIATFTSYWHKEVTDS